MSLSLLDDGREIAAAAVLHENIQDASLTINITVVVANDIVVVKVLEDVTFRLQRSVRWKASHCAQNIHF